jgi:hypothetical protein
MAGVARWLSLREAALMAGLPHKTFRRQLVALNVEYGGKLLKTFNRPGTVPRKYFVNPVLLERYFGLTKAPVEDELERLRSEVALLTRKVEKLRTVVVTLRHRVDAGRHI